MSSKTFAIDAAAGHIKRELGLAALTATAYVGVQLNQGGAAVTDYAVVVDVESCKVSAGDEVYTLRMIGSNLTNRSDGQILGTMELGDAGTIPLETVDTVAGSRRVLRVRSEVDQTYFQYIDLHLTAAGTSPSIGFGAFISREIV